MNTWKIIVMAVTCLGSAATWAYVALKRPVPVPERPNIPPNEMILEQQARISSLELRQTNLENECQATLKRANSRVQRAKQMVDSVEGEDVEFEPPEQPESDPDQLPMQLSAQNGPITLADVRAKARARRR